MSREYLMLAHELNPLKHKMEGSYMSEKLDGMRALWLPLTRGLLFQDCEFANTTRDERNHTCSGLWSRKGKPIFAPDWFLDKLPTDFPVDGELYTERGEGNRQDLMSIVKKFDPGDSDWQKVGYYIFDIPSYMKVFEPGSIRIDKEYTKFIPAGLVMKYGQSKYNLPRIFETNYNFLRIIFGRVVTPGYLKGEMGVLEQEQLPFAMSHAKDRIEERLQYVCGVGGEGLILRRPHSEWHPKRTHELLKVKKLHDMDGVVIGYTYGNARLHGMMGSIRVRLASSKERDLSGFTDLQRVIKHEFRGEANINPGRFTSESISDLYPIGCTLTFTYRSLTQDGIPEEARFLRKRDDV